MMNLRHFPTISPTKNHSFVLQLVQNLSYLVAYGEKKLGFDMAGSQFFMCKIIIHQNPNCFVPVIHYKVKC